MTVNETTAVTNGSKTAAPQRKGVSVALNDVHLAFGSNKVLRGISFEVPAATTACLIGPSGSGKSTTLRIVNRLAEPDSGDVLLDGRSVLSDNPDKLRQRVGMVFQHFNLFPHKTVRENVTLGLIKLKGLNKDEANERALLELDRVGLGHKADARPASLSGGQQQRVAIARALAMDPEVMLFDEATSALDPELVKGVLGTITELADSGMTLVVVTHEMGFARSVAEQVMFMDEGRIIESGHPDQVFEAPKSDRLRHFLSQVL
ncbi:amino acid ABC transporter ATP-binding protein [Bifidobacterium tibiigranuli]|jgi:polar amino acid transport system ATP-binding protein|uniref:amino acid ABC transporter ATP-binding protein n=1 Tax=Bifidobacterium tibiigranuli TaxID=2172043 RepID=UPI003DA96753